MITIKRNFIGLSIVVMMLFSSTTALAQRTKPSNPAPSNKPAASPAFDRLAAQANQEREAGNLDEAITLYKKAVALRPKWDEGLWYLATLLYERDQYEEAAKTFKQVSLLRRQVGAPLA